MLDDGYGRNFTDDELIQVGKDPFLIAYALADEDRVVATSEKSKTSAKRNDASQPWITPPLARAAEYRRDCSRP